MKTAFLFLLPIVILLGTTTTAFAQAQNQTTNVPAVSNAECIKAMINGTITGVCIPPVNVLILCNDGSVPDAAGYCNNSTPMQNKQSTATSTNTTQSNTVPLALAQNNTLLCNSAVCDNSRFNEFAFDKDINLLNIHIHKHSGVWHNERGVFVPWSALCNQGQRYLVQSCSNLIDSSGTLTQAGDTAVNCITNGAIITIAANTLQLPLGIIKGALGALAPMTGCDGIVNLDTIQSGPQVQSLLNALSNAVK